MSSEHYFDTLQPTSFNIWQKKYQLRDKDSQIIDRSVADMFSRVAKALASSEKDPAIWEPRFYEAMCAGAIPAGRILSNAGAEDYKQHTSQINCVVSEYIRDSIDGIFGALLNGATTLSRGSGVGYNCSSLRPKNAYIAGVGARTSGPIPFMEVFDRMCHTISSAGGRRGAQMLTLHVWHPDIREFIHCKRQAGMLRQFNLSVLVPDAFMDAVAQNASWTLYFPVQPHHGRRSGQQYMYAPWDIACHDYPRNERGEVLCEVYETVSARALWDEILTSTYKYGDPGVLFIDRINRENNLWFCEQISATNPCVIKGTKVATPEGWRPVESIMTGERVLTVDNSYLPVRSIEIHRNMDVFEVLLESGVACRVTRGHIFHVQRKHVKAGTRFETDLRLYDLQIGDKLRVRRTELNPINGAVELPDACDYFVPIQSIARAGTADVYDLHEPVTDTWITEGGIVSRGCGEQPLPPHGACLLGSVDLTRFVQDPLSYGAKFDFHRFESVVKVFARMLDNVVEMSGLPLPEQRAELARKRRHGMGFFGLGSALAMMQIPYGSPRAREFASHVSRRLALANWRAGVGLAEEKGPAPIMTETFEVTEDMLARCPALVDGNIRVGEKVDGKTLLVCSPYMRRLAEDEPALVGAISRVGSRFTHATSIAPTGSIALSVGNNASNGLEPTYAHEYVRNVIEEGHSTKRAKTVYSAEAALWRKRYGDAPLPECFVSAEELTPEQHVAMVCAIQPWIDSACSKTVNLPTDIAFDDFKEVYDLAYRGGAKGCATFRFDPEAHQGVLVTQDNLKSTLYTFTLDNGDVVEVSGDTIIEYNGEEHTAANLHDALKEGLYGRY